MVGETFATQLALIVVGGATGVLIARLLGPTGRGQLAAAIAVTGVGVQLGNLGLHAANTYFVSRDRSCLPGLLANSLLVGLVLGGVGAMIAYLAFAIWPEAAPVERPLLALGLVGVPLGLVYLLVQNLLLGLQQVRSYNVIDLVTRTLGPALVIAVALLGVASPATLVATGLLTSIVGCTWAIVRLRPHLTGHVKASRMLLRVQVRYGLRAYLAALFAFLVGKSTVLLVTYLEGSEQTGYYALAASLADLLYLLPACVGMILFPKLCSLEYDEDKRRYAVRAALAVGVVMILLVGLAQVLAAPAVRFLYGEAFLAAVPPFRWLAVAMALAAVNNVYSIYLASIGLPLFAVCAWLAAAMLNVVLGVTLIPTTGIVGAAIATFTCFGVMTVAQGAFLARAKVRHGSQAGR